VTCGVGISCIDLPSTVDIFADWIAGEHRQYVCVTGMHGVMESQTDATLRDIHNASGLTTPDGMPMVWAGRRAGAEISRVYGPDLMDAVLCRAVEEDGPATSWGFRERPDELVPHWSPLPGARRGRIESPPFRPLSEEEDAAMVERVNAAAPDIVWVGLEPEAGTVHGVHRQRLDAPVLVGSERPSTSWPARFPGAALDAAQRLEWVYRLGTEPRRLWRRYSSMAPGSPSAWCADPAADSLERAVGNLISGHVRPPGVSPSY